MDELQISGKRFVSARRIARDHGYTSDYIGQLIRGGKITGQKVGRAWYVDAASFDAYLGTAPAHLVEEEKTKINVKEEEVVAEPVVEIKKEEPPASLEKIPEPIVVKKEEEEVAVHIPLRVFKKEESTSTPVPAPTVRAEGLRYYADDAPALPEITPQKEESRISNAKTNSFLSPHKKYTSTTSRRVSPLAVGGIAVVGIAVFIFSALVSSTMTLNISIEAGNAAATSYGVSW